jgi:hypothetical protein
MKPFAFAVLAAALATAAPAAGAVAQPLYSAAAAGGIDAARQEADRLIEEAGARDLFTNISVDERPRVRHNRSGLVCTFGPGDEQNRIVIFNAGPVARGDDVGCASNFGNVGHTLYATHYPPSMSLRDALSGAAAAIKQRFPDAQWYEGEVQEAQLDRTGKLPLPQSMAAHYRVQVDGLDSYTVATLAEHNGWIFMQRMTTPMDEAPAAQLEASRRWKWVLSQVVDNGQTG